MPVGYGEHRARELQMKKLLLLLLLLITATSGILSAQLVFQLEGGDFQPEATSPFSLGLETGTGLGLIQEFVFYDRTADRTYSALLSRLDWQVLPLWFIGITGSLEFAPRWWAALGFWFGLPGPSGFMEDRDWDGMTGDYEIFSHHDNCILDAETAEATIGYSLMTDPTFILNLIAGFHFQRIMFSGRNGYQESPPGTFVQSFDDEVITYDLSYFTASLGLEAGFSPSPIFTIDARLSLSPFLAFVCAWDDHLLTSVTYLDFPDFGFTLQAAISLTVHVTPEWDCSVRNSFYWSPVFKGNTYSKPSDGEFYSEDSSAQGGSSRLFYSVSVGAVLKIK